MSFVVAIAGASSVGGAALTIVLVLLFITLMVFGARRALPRLLDTDRLAREAPTQGTLAVVVCVVVFAATRFRCR